MLGLVNRSLYDIHKFYIIDNHTRKTLLHIVKNKLYSYYNEDPAPADQNKNY